ncbi:hypothetical protein BaRGS_00003311 [Batillaria attramentaria]|uniref:J domain-containing protein n=1 Tax=Batillaria attramentaria TaxID=370345 RepID=A0ABD0M246_9CAEN
MNPNLSVDCWSSRCFHVFWSLKDVTVRAWSSQPELGGGMLGPVLYHTLLSGRLGCKRCLVAAGIRYVSHSHYDTLGIEKSASQEEVRAAFLSLSKQLHPDVNSKDPKNHEKFVRLNEAYMVLSKPLTRREYDLNLATRLQQVRNARNASSSHVYGSSAWPGTGGNYEYGTDAEQQRFWDETIWSMRDQTKDKQYEGRPYYSVGNMERIANSYILFGCFALMAFGIVVHYFAIRKSRDMHRAVLDEKDKIYYSNLARARDHARAHGNALQLQILKSKVTKTPLEVDGVSEESMRDAFSGGKK